MSELLNLYQRINGIRQEVSYVKKDKSVSTGGEGSYKAVTHDQITSITREHLVKYGVICVPYLVSSKSMPPLEGKKQWKYEAIYDFKFINVDKPSEFEIVRVEGHALDSGDKAPGKALSMCRKYASLKLFEVASGDEEENRYAEKEEVEFDLQFNIEVLKGCESLDSLKENYIKSVNQATLAKNSNAIKELAKVKDDIKKLLESKK